MGQCPTWWSPCRTQVSPSVQRRKVWLMPTAGVPCSNAAKTRNPMKLAGVTQTPGLVHYIYTFGGSCLVTEFCQVQNSLCILQVLCSHILVALLQGTWALGASQTLQRWAQGTTYIRQGDHSRWALAHILVVPTLLYLMMTVTLYCWKIWTEMVQCRQTL